ncbi:hydroxyethylthiazole kinase [Myroides injenensis]|uniref:hydroxyethylthiazole kinase n=1 Tax=Myroides injenensis TaxID=1183151 RepID=UPI000288A73B|nr:hydroxyethylthiazole kinase [Myroides injenensis]
MININLISKDINNIRELTPVVHNITNYVVMNTTANALLAIGASPIMAHELQEVKDMIAIASSLVLNIGTLDKKNVDAMLLAGKIAKEKGIPIVFDPVGVGATAYRTEVANNILNQCKPTIIRGNASEILSLQNITTTSKGVDSSVASDKALQAAKQLALQSQAIVVVSGQIDYITDGQAVITVKNGHPLMEKVTGMGCTATAIIAAFSAINSNALLAASHAMIIMGIAGELAAKLARGNGSMQMYFLDELFNINKKTIQDNILP